jgi:hypothetical protein
MFWRAVGIEGRGRHVAAPRRAGDSLSVSAVDLALAWPGRGAPPSAKSERLTTAAAIPCRGVRIEGALDHCSRARL